MAFVLKGREANVPVIQGVGDEEQGLVGSRHLLIIWIFLFKWLSLSHVNNSSLIKNIFLFIF